MHAPAWAQKANKVKPQPPVAAEKSGKLVYAVNGKGDRIPDYSYAGYKASEQPIPDAQVKVVVPVKPGDATVRIQAAIDYVAGLTANKSGLKGAVLLQKGTYEVNGSLKFKSSGVVLRGSGMGNDGTTLIAAGTDRETFIRIAGKDDRKISDTVKIADAYVPVNATSFNVTGKYKVGDHVFIRRPSTKNWIELLKTDHFGGGITALGWKPGERDVIWDRTITAVSGNKINIDAPLTTALDTAYGGGLVSSYQWAGRISNIGIENLKLKSTYDAQNSKDEAHRWMAITMENVQDAWVRQVAFEHFAGSAVFVLETGNRITVQDCKSTAPVSEIGGQRRYTFYTMGGQTLFQRLYAEQGYHDFAVGYCAPGPNAFVQCQAWQPHSFSGAIDSWSSGVLFDVINIDGQALSYANRGQDGQGAGWTSANSMFWNCSAGRVDCYQPPGAQNWAYGTWAQFQGDGYWEESNNTINPRSFYYAQLKERLGKDLPKQQSDILPFEGEASSSPTVEVAMALTANSVKPAVTIGDWVEQSSQRNPIAVNASGAKTIDQLGFKQPVTPALAPKMAVSNGWLVRGNTVLSGARMDSPWWNGSVDPVYLKKNAKPAITRWVPGRTGTGLTDDLNELADGMERKHIVGFEQNYALWYERRRDDHERIRRIDGDVWPPFYEVPFARSGKESAWDGLSKYDITTYNKWYWSRLKQFATLADQKGLVLINHSYFQHNIIEAGAHYADFPWRPVNNINNTGFPEPVPYAGDKRVFMAEQFYDETHPVRRKLHQAFIRQNLDAFADNNGVIQFISAEFTGPLHFAQFWVETIQQWEKEKGKNAITGISTTKDVQDAILANPALAPAMDVIDIRYWHYQADGKAYAPAGGQNLAPRQQARQFKPKATSFEQVYRAVSEYGQKYPDKAVIYSGDGFDRFGWAAFMAGGSLPNLPAAVDPRLLADASTMKIVTLNGDPKDQWALGNVTKGFIIYSNTATVATPAVDANANYEVNWIDTKTGKTISTSKQKGAKLTALQSPANGPVVLWLKRI
ncbi:DUF6298 domain-containing protein [Mucilaginibacter terrae]|nr:DUF6298 domain-containing protein [Mucilaginibacter terrae]